jgi:hypothetical protein
MRFQKKSSRSPPPLPPASPSPSSPPPSPPHPAVRRHRHNAHPTIQISRTTVCPLIMQRQRISFLRDDILRTPIHPSLCVASRRPSTRPRRPPSLPLCFRPPYLPLHHRPAALPVSSLRPSLLPPSLPLPPPSQDPRALRVQGAAPPPSPCAGQRGPPPYISQPPSLSCTARTCTPCSRLLKMYMRSCNVC